MKSPPMFIKVGKKSEKSFEIKKNGRWNQILGSGVDYVHGRY